MGLSAMNEIAMIETYTDNRHLNIIAELIITKVAEVFIFKCNCSSKLIKKLALKANTIIKNEKGLVVCII